MSLSSSSSPLSLPFPLSKTNYTAPFPFLFHVLFCHETTSQNPYKYWLYEHSSYHYTLFYTTAASSFSPFPSLLLLSFSTLKAATPLFSRVRERNRKEEGILRTCKQQAIQIKKMNLFLSSSFPFFFNKVLETQCFQGCEGNWKKEGKMKILLAVVLWWVVLVKKEKPPEEKRKKLFYPKVLYF